EGSPQSTRPFGQGDRSCPAPLTPTLSREGRGSRKFLRPSVLWLIQWSRLLHETNRHRRIAGRHRRGGRRLVVVHPSGARPQAAGAVRERCPPPSPASVKQQ